MYECACYTGALLGDFTINKYIWKDIWVNMIFIGRHVIVIIILGCSVSVSSTPNIVRIQDLYTLFYLYMHINYCISGGGSNYYGS
jgi:hypothetical protein